MTRHGDQRMFVRSRRAQLIVVGALAVTAAIAVVAAEVSGGWGLARGSVANGHVRDTSTRTAHNGTSTRPLLVSKRQLLPKPKVVRPKPRRIKRLLVGFTDPSRTMLVDGRTTRRRFAAEIRYPLWSHGPFPVIIFGHGYNATPNYYARLLDGWAKAGYVVVAPIFPVENAHAPGGPTREDLPNEPRDMTLVINELERPLTQAQREVSRLSNMHRIAVSGHSDGGDTALAAAYGPRRDRRITAAAILSGQEDPLIGFFRMPSTGPPLLAVQGTADTINLPSTTYEYYGEAAPPKYLLKIIGANHQDPYEQPSRVLAMVEKVTTAFFDRYLKGDPRMLVRLVKEGSAGSGSVLSSQQ